VLYGRINGNVTDSTGAVIPGASVRARDESTGIEKSTIANSNGAFTLGDLIPGTYQLTVIAPGFATAQQNNVSVLPNSAQRVDLKLTIGSNTQQVTVTDTPPVLQVDRAETAYNISREQVAELPTTSTTGRNFQSLYRLVPGATPPAEQNSAASNPQRSQATNVNGVSNATNTTRIDGAVDAFPWLPYLAAYLPPTDAIDNINVVTGSFNAEQGSAGGSAINVTVKSGTNNFHGSAWEYNSIAQFNAQAWQNRTGIRQKNIYNEVGGAIGGPIVRDRLFFFFDYNRVSVNKAINGTFSVPSLAMRAGDFSGTGTTIYDPATGTIAGVGRSAFAGNQVPSTRFAPAAVILLSKLPAPNIGSPGATTNNYFGSATNAFLRENYDTKVTYTPTDRTSYFGHYSISPNTISDPQVFGSEPGGPTFDGGQPGLATGLLQNVGLGFTHAFTSRFATDWNAGFTRQRVGANSTDLSLGDYGAKTLGIPGANYNGLPLYGGIPAFYFTTYTSLGNSTTGSPFTFRDNQYTGNANASYVFGQHTIRFGGEYLHSAINHIQPGSGTQGTNRGSFVFTGGATSIPGVTTTAINSFASFLLGQAENYQKSVQNFNPEALRLSTFAFYAQDTWQATPNLTLNYGLRYEYYPLPVADHFGTVRYDPSIRQTITDATGTHTVGTMLVGGKAGIPQHAYTSNGRGMIVPRFGISYRIDPKTVVRSGFGMTVDPDSLRNLLQAYPAAVATNISANTGYTAATSVNPGLQTQSTQVGFPTLVLPDVNLGYLPLPTNISTTTSPQNFKRGYIYSDNLSVQRELPFQLTTTVAYVGTIAVRQQATINPNVAPPGGGNAGRLLNTTYGANTNNTDISSLQPFRGSNYHGLQTQLSRMSANRISTGIVYTYSKAMNYSDNSGSSLVFAHPAYWDRNYAVAGYDRTHNFQWWTIFNLPFGKSQPFLTNGFAGYVLGGWRVGTVLSRVSGTPFSILDASSLLNAPGNTQVADENYGVPRVLNGRNNVGSTGFRYVNPAAFSSVTGTTPRFGNSARDSVRGPGFFNLDVSLKRSFPIHDQFGLDLMAESFDVTNTPQFANPTSNNANNVTSGAFGIITTSNVNRTLRLSGRIRF